MADMRAGAFLPDPKWLVLGFLLFSFLLSFHWRISNGLNSSSHQQFNTN